MALLDNIAGGFSGGFAIIGKVASTVLWGVILGGIAVVVLYILKFKHPLYLIFETAGGGKRLIKDRGWKNKKKNEFKALKNKDLDFVYPMSKYEHIQGKNTAYFALVRNQTAVFLDVSENPHFIPGDYDMREKLANDFKNTWSVLKPAEKFWDKYGAQILWVGSMGIFLIVIILILKRMDSIIALGNSAAQAQISANRQVIESIPALLMMIKVKKDGA